MADIIESRSAEGFPTTYIGACAGFRAPDRNRK